MTAEGSPCLPGGSDMPMELESAVDPDELDRWAKQCRAAAERAEEEAATWRSLASTHMSPFGLATPYPAGFHWQQVMLSPSQVPAIGAQVPCPQPLAAATVKGVCAAPAERTALGRKPYVPNTTVMFRNLPNDYTREMFIQLLEMEGFRGRYDFLYLPVDFATCAGLGYGFLNLVSHSDAGLVWKHFQGFTNWAVPSQKVCEITWGEPYQGLEENIDRYRNSPVMHETMPDEFQPLVFVDGRRVPFPAPTRRIRLPRMKLRQMVRSAESSPAVPTVQLQ